MENQSNTLIQFQASVLNGQTNEIHAFIEALAQEASNNYLLMLAEEYKFTTCCEGELYEGKRIMLARDLARLCYGTEDSMVLGQLCRRHDFPFLSLPEASKHDTLRRRLLTHFSLSKFASSRLGFATWDHVLIAAANGETPFARKVFSFIQANVMYAMADVESRRQTGRGVEENIAEQQGKTEYDVLLDRYPHLRAITDLALSTAKAMAIADAAKVEAHEAKLDAAQANANAARAQATQEYFTVAEYIWRNNLQSQLQKSTDRKALERTYKELSDHLRIYCMDNNIPFRKIDVGGKAWKDEYAYHVSIFDEVVPGWLKRRYAQEPLGNIRPLRKDDTA